MGRLTRLKKTPAAKLPAPKRAKHREAIRDAKSALEMSRYYEEARELSHRITTWALTLGPRPRRFVICSGGGPGIMEAANRGAAEAGGKSIGLSIELPHEQFANAYISPELSLNFHYFFMRKLWFAQIAKALIVFPGGFGTMDELWEMLTLLQTGKLPRNNLIIIYGRKYWDEVLNFRAMVRWGMINPDEYKMLQFADTVDEAFHQRLYGADGRWKELRTDKLELKRHPPEDEQHQRPGDRVRSPQEVSHVRHHPGSGPRVRQNRRATDVPRHYTLRALGPVGCAGGSSRPLVSLGSQREGHGRVDEKAGWLCSIAERLGSMLRLRWWQAPTR